MYAGIFQPHAFSVYGVLYLGKKRKKKKKKGSFPTFIEKKEEEKNLYRFAPLYFNLVLRREHSAPRHDSPARAPCPFPGRCSRLAPLLLEAHLELLFLQAGTKAGRETAGSAAIPGASSAAGQ